MKLTAIRVQNYKRVEDTGWISARDLTVLVGKNEAGKSAILRGLSKINPSDGERYDGLREYPRKRYSSEFDEDDPAGSARFELSDDDRAALTGLSPLLAEAETVEVTRQYSNRYIVDFSPSVPSDWIFGTEVKEAVEETLALLGGSIAPDGHGPEYKDLKASIATALTTTLAQMPATGSIKVAFIESLATGVTSEINEQWQKTALDPVAAPLRALVADATARSGLGAGRTWVVNNMPRFVYFDHYDVLESAVHIPTFLAQMRETPQPPRVRTTRCLFDHVNLDPQQLHDLVANESTIGQEEMRRRVDERKIRTTSAEQAMTERFGEWWLQRRHKFHYDADGNYFRVWVSDDLDPAFIELDQRSQGMQYFFSFFLVFLVEAEAAHVNSILLLDEPGNSLHGTAQAKIIEFLRKVSTENQVIYSTHSPFMVDGEHLEEVRAVWEDPETGSTKVSEDVWPKDKDALFPLQAALGYQLVQSLFISRHQVLIEGITDYWIMKALDAALSATRRTALNPKIILTPAGGAPRMVPLASMLVGHEVQVAALLDGDESGRKEGRKLERVLGFDNKTVFVGDHTHDENPGGEIEDLFPDDYYLSAVKAIYGAKDLRFNGEEKALPNIIDRLNSVFERKNWGSFEKWKVARALADKIAADPSSVPDETLDSAAAIAQQLNSVAS